MTAAFDQRISLLDEVIVNPQTPEEEALENARIARECAKIRAENEAANAAGLRRRRQIAYEPAMMRMDYLPPVYSLSFTGGSPAYLGSH